MAEPADVAIESALNARAQALAASLALTIAMPYVAFQPPTPSSNAAWLRSTYIPADTLGLGVDPQSSNQHYGLFWIDVFYAVNTGEYGARRIAAQVCAYFKRGTELTKDGFTVQIWKPPFARPTIREDTWLHVPVLIPFIAFASNPA